MEIILQDEVTYHKKRVKGLAQWFKTGRNTTIPQLPDPVGGNHAHQSGLELHGI